MFVLISHQQTLKLTKINEQTQIELAKKSISRDFASILPDIHFLLSSGALQDFLADDNAQSRNNLAHNFASFARHKRIYDQVRFLDSAGRELIRVNYSEGHAVIVPKTQLQDKKGRYYFRETRSLREEDVYISPLDLNVEGGKLETPHKPTIRFCAPLFDETGKRRGTLILNYLAENMLTHFDEMLVGSKGHIALVNSDGYWIRSHKKDREWGFILDSHKTFETVHPEAWAKIQLSDSAQIKTQTALFTYTKIYPNRIGNHQPHDNYALIIISDVPLDSLYQDSNRNFRGILEAALLAALLVGAITSWGIAHYQVERKRMREQINLHAQVYRATNDGVIITDTSGTIIDVNEAFTDITGYTRNEVLGQNPKMLSSGKQDKTFYKTMWSKLSRTGTWEGEVINRSREGRIFVEWLRISAVKDSDGITTQYVGVISDITAKKQTEEELHRNAHHDLLTGLPNRLSFDQILEQEINHADRNGSKLALLYIDLNRFKPINDNYGHLVGDIVLRVIGERLSSVIRATDSIARYGGDEFIALLTDINDDATINFVVERMIEELHKPVDAENTQHRLGASIGISIYPEDTTDARELIARADAAMYQAKQGKDRHYVYYRDSVADATV